MLRRPSIRRAAELVLAVLLLVAAGAANVLAEGVQASSVGLYVGLPGRGGRLASPVSNRSKPLESAAQRVLITTAENAPNLQAGWEASARAAVDLDPQLNADLPEPRFAVVLTETHAEGRVHTIEVHPEDLEASLPLHLGPTHHEGGGVPWRAA